MRKDAIIRAIIEKKFLQRTRNYLNEHLCNLPFQVGVFLATKFVPVQENKIIFITTRGEYDCNAKWIAEELHKRKLPYEIVWTIRKNVPLSGIPAEFTKTYRGSYDFYRHLASAKIIIDNSTNTAYLCYRKKRNQILIETWHGSLGIKMFSKETNKDKVWCKKAELEGRMTDYCLSNSTFEDKIFTDTFWPNARILQLGHARNDILCQQDPMVLESIRKKVFAYFDLSLVIANLKQERHEELEQLYRVKIGHSLLTAESLEKENPFDALEDLTPESLQKFLKTEYAKCEDLRICLYAPTFRDDGDMQPYQIDYTQLRQALRTRFGGNWVILTRFHFRLRKELHGYSFPAGVINASGYSDIQELLTCTDVGITDYSSWICDYMLTRRPGFLFATDMEQYQQRDREFFYPLDTMPFPLALNSDQLIQNILQFDQNQFIHECDIFLKDKGCIDDGHAASRIADTIEKIIKGEKI